MLRDVLVFLMAALAIVPISRRFRISPVIGYLLVGAMIGPYAFGLIGEIEQTHRLAEFGIVFMLFAIGLELSFDRLKSMARYIFGLGTLQVAVSGGALGLCAVLLGASWGQAAVIGGALALSSTAFVLQILTERGELATRFGRIVLAVLLLQDLAVVPGLAVVTALGREPEALGGSLALAGVKALVALVVLLALGRLVLRPLYRIIADVRSPELFAAATLLVVLGTAWATEEAGLSMALGAFLAGLMLAGTEFRHQIEADIRPVRGILLGLFFISVGMLIDLQLVLSELPQILLFVAGIIIVKAVLLTLLGLMCGLSLPVAVNTGLHLSQGGEFAFVLFSLAMGTTVLPLETGQILLGAVAITMGLTPLLAAAGRRAQHFLERRDAVHPEIMATDTASYSDHVIIAGFGRVGRTIAAMLDAENQRWVAVDTDATIVAEAHRQGLPVFFGDAGQRPVLHAVGVERARTAVITTDDASAAGTAIAALRKGLPDLPIVVRARDHKHMSELMNAGATTVMPEMTEASLLLGRAVLQSLGMADDQADGLVKRFREDAYAQIREIARLEAGSGDVETAELSPRNA